MSWFPSYKETRLTKLRIFTEEHGHEKFRKSRQFDKVFYVCTSIDTHDLEVDTYSDL